MEGLSKGTSSCHEAISVAFREAGRARKMQKISLEKLDILKTLPLQIESHCVGLTLRALLCQFAFGQIHFVYASPLSFAYSTGGLLLNVSILLSSNSDIRPSKLLKLCLVALKFAEVLPHTTCVWY